MFQSCNVVGKPLLHCLKSANKNLRHVFLIPISSDFVICLFAIRLLTFFFESVAQVWFSVGIFFNVVN